MTENKILIENKKPIETVAELKETNGGEKYDKKTSHLSKSAQGLVNRKSGGDYVSENREGYGPCSASSCPYSTSFGVKIPINSGIAWWGRNESNIGIDPFPESDGKGSSFNSYLYTADLKLDNVDQARNAIRGMEKDGLYAVNLIGFKHRDGDSFEYQAKESIREAIKKHERGESVSMNSPVYIYSDD